MLTGWLRKKKPYHTWLVSYFAFVLLFVLFAFIMTMTAKGIVQEAVTKANVESFSTMNTIVHTLKNDLDSLGVRDILDGEITHDFRGSNTGKTVRGGTGKSGKH